LRAGIGGVFFGGGRVFGGVGDAGGHGPVEGKGHDEDEAGEAAGVLDLGLREAEAAGFEVRAAAQLPAAFAAAASPRLSERRIRSWRDPSQRVTARKAWNPILGDSSKTVNLSAVSSAVLILSFGLIFVASAPFRVG
jgi:hypothetical protein